MSLCIEKLDIISSIAIKGRAAQLSPNKYDYVCCVPVDLECHYGAVECIYRYRTKYSQVLTHHMPALLGVFHTPNAHTLSGVMAVNGSNANGGCPTEYVVLPAGINTCDCTDSTLGAEAIIAMLSS